MLDINEIRENRKKVETALLKRLDRGDFDLDKIIKLDDKRKDYIRQAEELKAKKNKFSKTKPDEETIKQMKNLGQEIKDLDGKLKKIQEELDELLGNLPNLAADDVVSGGKQKNQVIQSFGDKPEFDFKTKDHIELAESLNLVDYQRAVKMSGHGFWAYIGEGALLEWALLNYFIAFHRQNGYSFVIPPFLLNQQSAFASGHLPKFTDDLYWTQDGLCLDATSEMEILNLHRAETLPVDELPKKYFAYSTCFRREAGSYRKEERGMIRGHQFNKVEMFQFCKPLQSWQAFDELVKYATQLTEDLGLHFRLSLLAAGDMSAAAAKTIDVEVWIPSMGIYKEISSISNALDFQARRANIKYKTASGDKAYVHTLNASGLATSRLVPAILEQNQQADGSVVIPRVLREFMAKDTIQTNR